LPDTVEKKEGVSLWSMIKDNIGKDLTSVYLPVYFNESISSLQKCFEDLEYSWRILEETKEILQLHVVAVLGWTSVYQSKCCCCKVSVLDCGSVVLKQMESLNSVLLFLFCTISSVDGSLSSQCPSVQIFSFIGRILNPSPSHTLLFF